MLPPGHIVVHSPHIKTGQSVAERLWNRPKSNARRFRIVK
jgi:hypothetical protein